jgi:hypothetical protein
MDSACLIRRRAPDAQPLITKTASLEQLIERLEPFGDIESFRSRVRLRLSVTSEDQTEIKDYPESDGFILTQRPSSIRVRAEFPVVGSTVFDMSSDGVTFQVHLPTKNRYLVGRNALNKPSKKRSENVRPQHILDALILDPPRENEQAVFYNEVFLGNAYHIVSFLRTDDRGMLRYTRKIWFDRVFLRVSRQQIFDQHGDLVTDAWYREWTEQDPAPFPGEVSIRRPKDGYDLTVQILKPRINGEILEDAFDLKPAPDVKIEEIGGSDTGNEVSEVR